MSEPRAVDQTELPLGEAGIERLPAGILVVRDVLDGQLLGRDGARIARVADVEFESGSDGSLRAVAVAFGPEALAGRIARPFEHALGRLLGGRFDHRIAFDEIMEVGPWLRLRGASNEYETGQGDRWLGDHLLRFVPGSGHAAETPRRRRRRWRRGA